MLSSVMVPARCGCTVVAPVSPESVSKLWLAPKSRFIVLHVSQHETISLLKDDVATLHAELFQLKESVVALQASKLCAAERN